MVGGFEAPIYAQSAVDLLDPGADTIELPDSSGSEPSESPQADPLDTPAQQDPNLPSTIIESEPGLELSQPDNPIQAPTPSPAQPTNTSPPHPNNTHLQKNHAAPLPTRAPNQFDLAPPANPNANPVPAQDPNNLGFDIRSAREGGVYRLGPGDVLVIRVFGVPEFSGTQRILIDGTITLPLINTVSVQGLTLQEASTLLGQLYDPFLKRPIVTLSLEETVRPLRVAIIGSVNLPGVYDFQINAGDVPSITNLIQLAGGLTQQADVRDVQIRRPQPSGVDEILSVNLWVLLQEGDRASAPILLDGDTVVINEAENVILSEASRLAASSLAPESIQVSVVGQVAAPGTLELPPISSMNQALLTAGGFTEEANRSKVELLRLNPNGTVTQREIAINFEADVNEETNPLLQNSDVIVVDNSRISKIGNALTLVQRPILPFATLLQIIRNIQQLSEDISGGGDDDGD